MEEFIIQQNIRRFERLLAEADDSDLKPKLLELLAVERRRLADLCAGDRSAQPPRNDPPPGEGGSGLN